ncbi:MurJ-like flippase [Neorhodopirellula pilleata]|uniref:MurJ-like flippase n=2 Tax=Neorhodopirellula pilleata TaxID=2714738 RepID=A0A5C6AAM0_9BACT|nr:MurJ-like flippase [Neorhodopirellula pilleata]
MSKAPIALINRENTRTVLSLADQFVISGTRFITSWMIARYCGAEQLGYYALGFSVLILIDLILQAFVSAPYTIFSQRITSNRSKRYTGNSLVQSGFVGVIGISAFMAIGCFAFLAESNDLANVMFVLAVSVPFCVVREFARRHCFATEQVGLALGFDSLFAVCQLGLMYLLLENQHLNSVTAHGAGGLACAVALSVWLFACRGQIELSLYRWKVNVRKHWRFGRWVFVSQTMNQLNWNIVQWIIAFWLSTEATGVFTGCLTIAFLSNPFVLGIANMIYPRLAGVQTAQGSQAMHRLAVQATVAIGVVMVAFTLVLLFAGQYVCDFLFSDPAYANAGLLPAILAAAVSCLAITMPFDGCLWAEHRTALSSAASALGVGVTAIAVLALVHWGTTAAAIGLLIGCAIESSARVVFFIRSRRFSIQSSRILVLAS